ncbi:hypothetical protein [Neobacillus dielmonensis]|uniref:hypothetical protein n=1 Tax=Neobacillus dielmonensis TaxID=1347369 RepID=UPI0005AB786B|nr:hypothetical protein [Neobacillus dielmonensis]
MHKKHLQALLFMRKTACYASWLGIILLVTGFFTNGFVNYFFTGLGFGILFGSFLAVLMGTFLSLMSEQTHNSKRGQFIVLSTGKFTNRKFAKRGGAPALTLIEGGARSGRKASQKNRIAK